MITGFNTDVDHDGQVFHVQTEDKGRDNPIVETLVYTRGEIVESRRKSYADLTSDGSFPEQEIQRRMERQHQSMIREIRNGKYDEGGPKPFGHSIITNRSLDEVALEFLRKNDRLQGLALDLVEDQVLTQGDRHTVKLRVSERGSTRPVSRAQVRLRLISTHEPPRDLSCVSSDENGLVEVSVEIPELPEADMAVVCEASAVEQRAEIRKLVHRPAKRKGKTSRATL